MLHDAIAIDSDKKEKKKKRKKSENESTIDPTSSNEKRSRRKFCKFFCYLDYHYLFIFFFNKSFIKYIYFNRFAQFFGNVLSQL